MVISNIRKAYSSDTYAQLPVSPAAPGGYKWNLYDVSSEDSGNTQNGQMQKMMLGQKTKLELVFKNITISQAATLLALFNNEYTELTYLDLLTGTNKTEVFYTGDRAAPVYSEHLGIIEELTFNLIGRDYR